MRRAFIFTKAILPAGLTLLLPVAAAGTDLPKRKPGLWEITTVSPASGMTTVRTCVGPDDNIALPSGAGECSEPKVMPAGGDVIVDVACTSKAGTQKMSTAFSGDFSARYRAVMKMTFDPPVEGTAHLGATIDGKYIGPECEPDESGGGAGKPAAASPSPPPP